MSLIGFKLNYDTFYRQVESIILEDEELLKDKENQFRISQLINDYIKYKLYYKDLEKFFPGISSLKDTKLSIVICDSNQIYIGYQYNNTEDTDLNEINTNLYMFKVYCPYYYLENTTPTLYTLPHY
jgi:hypothetical protein